MDRVIKIAEYYGLENQLYQLTEEMGELIQAISKLRRVNGKGAPVRGALSHSEALGNIIGEIEDVRICSDQIIYLLQAHEVAEDMRNYKLDRTIKDIEKEKYICTATRLACTHCTPGGCINRKAKNENSML